MTIADAQLGQLLSVIDGPLAGRDVRLTMIVPTRMVRVQAAGREGELVELATSTRVEALTSKAPERRPSRARTRQEPESMFGRQGRLL